MGESFENLKVWQKAHELMLFVHCEVVPLLPREEKWDLADQIRRSSKSVGANGEAQRLLNGYIDYLKREKPGNNEPGSDINIDRGHIHFDNDSSYPDP